MVALIGAVLGPAAVALLVATSATGANAVAAPSSRLLFHIADPRITEASGIAPGIASPGVDYVENDSGDTSRFFALDRRTGATAATITVAGARNVDWEDIAAAPDAAGTPSVWLADIGDNGAVRDEVQVYRVAEPHVRASDRNRTVRAHVAAIWRLRYPGGPVDAESLAVAPDGTGYLVTKSLATSTVYRLPARPDAGRVQAVRRVATVTFAATGTPNPFGIAGALSATSAAIAPDGSAFVVRTYSDAYVWPLDGAGLRAALARPPTVLALPRQPQGEGVGITRHALVIDSEGRHAAVYAVPLPEVSGAPTSPSPAPRSSASRPAPRSGHDAGIGWPVAVGAAAAVLALAVAFAAWRRRSR